MKRFLRVSLLILLAASFAASPSLYAQQQITKLPADQVGPIEQPEGMIAFLRNGNVWIMNSHGQSQMMVCEATNARGRVSWSPDGKRIAFTRSGQISLQAPDMTGGQHKVYDLFLAFIDKALADSTFYWYRISDGLGSRDPQWTPSGELIYMKDMNANLANATFPNYQVVVRDSVEGDEVLLRKDWQNMPEFLMAPSMNKNGDIACVHFYDNKPQGLVVLNRDNFMTPLKEIKTMSSKLKDAVAPGWSPDGKWIAYVSNDMNNPGLYITTPDLEKQYLVFEPPPSAFVQTVAPSFSPDSKWLTFATTDGSIWVIDITGNNAKRLTGPGQDYAPAWSKGSVKLR